MTLVQMPCVEGNREHNFKKAKQLLERYKPEKGVQFIQFPELFAIGFRHEDYQKEGPGVPGPTSEFLVSVAEEFGSQEPGDIVKSRSQQTRGDKSEENGVYMHGSHPAKVDVFNIGHEVRRNQVTCADHSKGGCPGKPKCGCQRKRYCRRIV